MAQEFVLTRQNDLPATPAQVWEAIATSAGSHAWIFPIEIEPGVGGLVSRGPAKVTAWDPWRRFACLCEREDGFTSAADYRIEAHDGDSRSVLYTTIRWTYVGTFDEAWDTKTDAAIAYTNVYFHTLEQYMRHFKDRPATYVSGQGPVASSDAGAFVRLRKELGLDDAVVGGDAVRVAVPGLQPVDAVVDYAADTFIGLRTADGLYRFFGGERWGWPIGLGHHLFADEVDQDGTQEAWRAWLENMFA